MMIGEIVEGGHVVTNAQSRKAGWLVLFAAMMLFLLWGAPSASVVAAGSEPLNVGMVTLLANPERFDGTLIRTHGFVFIQPDSDAIYLHEDDYRYGLTKNAFALDLSEAQRKQFKKLSLKYVLIEGTMHSKSPDATYSYSGTIVNVTRLEAWGPWYPAPHDTH